LKKLALAARGSWLDFDRAQSSYHLDRREVIGWPLTTTIKATVVHAPLFGNLSARADDDSGPTVEGGLARAFGRPEAGENGPDPGKTPRLGNPGKR
jgi:hypothetical protein